MRWVASTIDALGHITSYGYDALNRQLSVTDALNQTTSFAYDKVGDVVSVTDALGRTTSYTYDNLNRQVATTDALGQTKLVAYDAVNNVVGLTDKLGQVTSFTYDTLNRRTKITDPLGHAQTTVYDSVGNTLSITDGLGNKTAYTYDALNRNVKVTDAKGGITSTNYDAVGNLVQIADSVGNATNYAYDALDRLITDTNQLGFSRHYTYDAVGNEVEMVDRNGRKTTYGYDNLNRNTSENWIDSTRASVRAIGYTYDAVGRLITESDPDSQYTFGYDAVDRITSIDNTGTTGSPAVVFTYAYDAVSNLISVAERINGTNSGQTNYTYDLLNRTTRITQSGTGVQSKRVDLTYNKVDLMTSLTRFSDLGGMNLVATTSYTYNNNQKLVQLAHTKGATNLDSFDYTYDSANRLTKIASTLDGSVDYTYDATNQLTGADYNTSQTDEAYTYDANGNRTNGGYQTGTNNQLLTDGHYTYQYDREGNRTQRTEIATGKVTEYVWDYHDRLTSVLFKDASGTVTKTISYTYDVNNQRIGKKIDGVVAERYVYDGANIALVFDGAGVQTHRYLYGAGVDQILADERGGTVVSALSGAEVWALVDNLGTVRDVVDSSGVVLNHINYDSFGKIVNQSNPSVVFRYGYTGREQDNETGLDYYRARYYDSAVGRFISEDPIGFNAGDANLTRYVGNSPTNFIDPDGYKGVPPTPKTTPTITPVPKITPAIPKTTPGILPKILPFLKKLPFGQLINILDTEPVLDSPNRERDAINQSQPVPDPNCSVEERKKEEEKRKKKCKSGKFLYRGDSRNPYEATQETGEVIFVNGFTPRGTNANFENHVNFKPQDTAFISTSKDKQVGIDYATDFRKREGYLYLICDPGEALGKNIRRDAQTIYNNKKYGGRHPFAYQKEIAFKGGIPTEYVINATHYSQNQKSGSVFFNPNYNP
jgi:RHS repeat-associated protein